MKVPKNAVYMKQNNRKIIINMIHRKPISRAELARKTGLTRAAISGIVDDLINQGIVIETGLGESVSGRKPVELGMNSEHLYCLGISIRYDYCLLGISDINGKVVDELRLDFSNFKNANEGMEIIGQSLKEMILTNVTDQIVLGIGISSPGPVDIYSGTILNPPKLEMWQGFPIVEKLKEKFDLEVFLDRDAVASTLVEKNYGKGRKYKNFILIDVINNGIGCGIVINDALYRGVNGFGGEFGHISIDFNGKQCRCGNIGCIECYASVEAIIENIDKKYSEIKNWENIVVRSKNDDTFVQIIKQEAHYLGAGVINVMNLLEFEAVILSGEVVFEPYLLINELRQYVNQKSITRSIKTIDVLVSEQDYNLNFVSSATIISEKFFSGELMEF